MAELILFIHLPESILVDAIGSENLALKWVFYDIGEDIEQEVSEFKIPPQVSHNTLTCAEELVR